jgi:hypothetical protein
MRQPRSVLRASMLLGPAAALTLTACGSTLDRAAGEETSAQTAALATCTSFSTFHLLDAPVPATPPGELMGPDATSASGFSPTHVIEPNGFIWYTDPLTGSFNGGSYALNLWTNHPGGFSPVFAQVGVGNADGSAFSPIAVSPTIDVNLTGTGNHVTTLGIGVPAPITLTNQRLIAKVFLELGSGTTAPTMVYNGGVDFDTNLQTTGGCATPTVTTPVAFHLVGAAEPGVTPAGDHLRRTNTSARGFTPTLVLNATPRFWYTEPVNAALPAAAATFVLWTNSPGASSVVNVRVERTEADGSRALTLAQASADVNASGRGNHATRFALALPAISLSSQRLRVRLVRTIGNANATAAFNGGPDFDTRLEIPASDALTSTDVPVFKDAQIVLSSAGGGGPNDNLGSAPDVVIGNLQITSRGLFGYSLFGVPTTANVTKAELVIPPVEGIPGGRFTGGVAKVIDSASWLESTVTWNTQPAATDLGIRFTLQQPSPTSARVDVTNVVAQAVRGAEGQISFLISPVDLNAFIWSKENTSGAQPTSLHIEYR